MRTTGGPAVPDRPFTHPPTVPVPFEMFMIFSLYAAPQALAYLLVATEALQWLFPCERPNISCARERVQSDKFIFNIALNRTSTDRYVHHMQL